MPKTVIKLGVLSLLAAAIATMPMNASAGEENSQAAEAKKKAGAVPFNGKLKAVDTTANTIAVGNMTIQVTSETKIMKDGKTATLSDGVVGETVAGAYKKADDGKLSATSIRFGAKPEKSEQLEAKKE
jgi:hypothetical protein